MAFAEDITAFFKAADFAVDVVYSGTTYQGIFDAEYADENLMAGSLPMATMSTSDASNIPVDGAVTISGTIYLVREKHQDGTGVTMLILEEQ